MTVSLARVVTIVLLVVLARPAAAQVFLSTEPHPEFTIAPLFVSLSVSSAAEPPPRLTIFWSIAVPPTSTQPPPPDLILLLPFAIAETRAQANAGDPDLAKFVTERGFTVERQGAVGVVGRNRTEMGSGRPPQTIGTAPYVTFVRDSAERGRSRSAATIRIPWTHHLTSKDWLVGVDMVARELVSRKPTSWYDQMFWGPRWNAAVSFGDLRHTALYPLYFELRHNVVDLGRDFSMLTINLADADHLRIDQVTPATAIRQPSESRRNTEQVSVPLAGGAGIAPQAVRVSYTYFSGSFEWRPIVISLLFLLLGNITGPVVVPMLKQLARNLKARIHVGAEPNRQSGVLVDGDTIAKLQPGQSTLDDVLKLLGTDYEEHERKHGDDAQRMLTYRGQRLVPHRDWKVGRLSHVRHWDIETHEVDVELQEDRVADVQTRIRRAKWVPTQTV